ncbi:sugar kinase [Streptomyces sp. KLOTTS4A1]|uniref:sugar kinase n=1 Tax=Streptomyces sp. KLOTTS4A1 TaxID=3390996 RepID=UPI0039F6423F
MPTVPRQSSPPDEPVRQPEDRRHMIRRRWLTAIIIVLLIGVPAGYLAISAGQSRDSGRDKEERYSATGLTEGWPTRLQRRVYEVPVPGDATEVAYYETNNWRTSRLYIQFQTTQTGLGEFLEGIGASTEELESGKITISGRDRRIVGWDFAGEGRWSGLTHEQADPRPTRDVTVDTLDPLRPTVYVVSTANP